MEELRQRRPYPDEEHGDSDNNPAVQLYPGSPGQRAGTRAPQARAARWLNLLHELPPQITRNQIEWIAISNTIGTGLFLGSSSALRFGGPAGMLIGFIVTSLVAYVVGQTTGEMVAFRPAAGGIVRLADEYVDPALGFAMGWNSWYHWTIIVPAQLSASAVLLTSLAPSDWTTARIKTMNATLTAALLILAVGVNSFGMQVYGRIERWFWSIKVFTIIGLIIACIAIDRTPIPTSAATPYLGVINGTGSLDDQCVRMFGLTPDATSAIFRTNCTVVDNLCPIERQAQALRETMPDAKVVLGFKYWDCPGRFVEYRNITGSTGHFLGTWAVLMQAVFSYSGMEVPGIAGNEVIRAQTNIRPAIKSVWIQVTFLYTLGVFVVGLVAPSNHVLGPPKRGNGYATANSSPFIIAIKAAEARVLPKILAILFAFSAWSAAASEIYVSSRMVMNLAERGHAPRFFRLCYDNGLLGRRRVVIPWAGISLVAIIGTFALWTTTRADDAFVWLSQMTTCAALLHWLSMLWTYIRWSYGIRSRRQELQRERNYFQHPWYQPWGAMFALGMCILILVFNGWAVFTVQNAWKIAEETDDIPPKGDLDYSVAKLTPKFIFSYLPLPVFLLCIFGYKLIVQSQTVSIEEMEFSRAEPPRIDDVWDDGHWTDVFQPIVEWARRTALWSSVNLRRIY